MIIIASKDWGHRTQLYITVVAAVYQRDTKNLIVLMLCKKSSAA